MDDGRGHLRELAKEVGEQIERSGAAPDSIPMFKVMETVEIRGSKFQIMDIKNNRMTLRVLPR